MDKVRLALIGSGPMGRDLLKNAVSLEQVQFVGAADPNQEAAEKAVAEAGSGQAFSDGAALLETLRPDAVIVASPPFLHRAHTELALAAGAHVFCEKPMATNVADCDAMLAAAKAAGRQLMIGQVLRYLSPARMVIELVKSGELGEPRGVAITRIGGGYGGAAATSWRFSHEQSGGILLEINAHEIDFMRCLCGEVDTVFCSASEFGPSPLATPDNIYLTMCFRNGAAGTLHSSMASYLGEGSGKIQCTQGTIFYGRGAGDRAFIVGKPGAEPQYLEMKDEEGGVHREVREFIEALVAGTPVTIPGEEGRNNVAVAEAAYRSAATGEVVKVSIA